MASSVTGTAWASATGRNHASRYLERVALPSPPAGVSGPWLSCPCLDTSQPPSESNRSPFRSQDTLFISLQGMSQSQLIQQLDTGAKTVDLTSPSPFFVLFQKTPGPGAYTASRQFPKQSPTIAKMGREHSLFFNNTIGF